MESGLLVKFALGVAVLMLGLWGFAAILHPEWVHEYFSNEPMNHTYAGMMGAAMLGLAFISLSNFTGIVKPARSLGIAILFLVIVSVLLMLVAETMLVTPLTSISLVFAGAIAFFLIF